MLVVVDSSKIDLLALQGSYRLVGLSMDEPGSSGLKPSPVEDEAAHDSDSALSTDEASTCTPVSILERLRSPPPSDLAQT